MLIFFHYNDSTGRNLCWCSLLTHLLVKICPAFRIQSLKLTYHIGLSSQQETNKQGQNDCYEKGTGLTVAVGWGFILKLLLAGEKFNSFLLDGISKHFFLSFLVFYEPKLIGENVSSQYTLNLSNWPLYSRQRNKDKMNAMRKGQV